MKTIQDLVYESMCVQKSCISWLKDSSSSKSRPSRHFETTDTLDTITVIVPTSWNRRYRALKIR